MATGLNDLLTKISDLEKAIKKKYPEAYKEYKENLIITNDLNIVYNCNYCKKQFINKYTLKIHTNTNCYIKKFNDYNSNCEHNNDVNNINNQGFYFNVS